MFIVQDGRVLRRTVVVCWLAFWQPQTPTVLLRNALFCTISTYKHEIWYVLTKSQTVFVHPWVLYRSFNLRVSKSITLSQKLIKRKHIKRIPHNILKINIVTFAFTYKRRRSTFQLYIPLVLPLFKMTTFKISSRLVSWSYRDLFILVISFLGHIVTWSYRDLHYLRLTL